MNGVITGGWEYVWLAYGVSAAVLAAYGISLAFRMRSEREQRRRTHALAGDAR